MKLEYRSVEDFKEDIKANKSQLDQLVVDDQHNSVLYPAIKGNNQELLEFILDQAKEGNCLDSLLRHKNIDGENLFHTTLQSNEDNKDLYNKKDFLHFFKAHYKDFFEELINTPDNNNRTPLGLLDQETLKLLDIASSSVNKGKEKEAEEGLGGNPVEKDVKNTGETSVTSKKYLTLKNGIGVGIAVAGVAALAVMPFLGVFMISLGIAMLGPSKSTKVTKNQEHLDSGVTLPKKALEPVKENLRDMEPIERAPQPEEVEEVEEPLKRNKKNNSLSKVVGQGAAQDNQQIRLQPGPVSQSIITENTPGKKAVLLPVDSDQEMDLLPAAEKVVHALAPILKAQHRAEIEENAAKPQPTTISSTFTAAPQSLVIENMPQPQPRKALLSNSNQTDPEMSIFHGAATSVANAITSSLKGKESLESKPPQSSNIKSVIEASQALKNATDHLISAVENAKISNVDNDASLPGSGSSVHSKNNTNKNAQKGNQQGA